MRKIMRRRMNLFLVLIIALLVAGCIKETYDMNKLSKDRHLSPSIAIAAMQGSVLFSDMVKSNDTVVYSEGNIVKLKFRVESVIDLRLADFYDLSNMVTLNHNFTMGNLTISDFRGVLDFTLDKMSASFPNSLQRTMDKFKRGMSLPFPPIPALTLKDQPFNSPFSNFENAVFSSGDLIIKITNTMPGTIKQPLTINLYNSSDNTTIVSGMTFKNDIAPGQSDSVSVSLAGVKVTNSITASVILSGISGKAASQKLDITKSGIQITLAGKNLKIKSGRVVLPQQSVTTIDTKDTIAFDAGAGIEMDEVSILTGNFSYNILSTSSIYASLRVTSGKVVRANGDSLVEVINVIPSIPSDSSISLNSTVIKLNADPNQPFNKVPITYKLDVSSDNNIIDFDENDNIQLGLKLLNPNFDYAKGYFGQRTETIKADSLDLMIADALKRLKGEFFISDPSIKLNYFNSFAIPGQLNLTAVGKRQTERVNLRLDPLTVATPTYPPDKEISSVYSIDKENSSIDSLVSLPPEVITFSGTVNLNPGINDGSRNNYVFGSSRFFAFLDIEVPMQFKMSNLQFSDTLDNSLGSKKGSDTPFKADNIDSLRIILTAKNGFPIGIAVKISLRDSVSKKSISTIEAPVLLQPAPVDGNGKAVGQTETKTTIRISKQFFSSIDKSDKIIFDFTLNTTGNGSKDIVIYPEYKIDFSASVAGTANIIIK
jgi:hypothetical protein